MITHTRYLQTASHKKNNIKTVRKANLTKSDLQFISLCCHPQNFQSTALNLLYGVPEQCSSPPFALFGPDNIQHSLFSTPEANSCLLHLLLPCGAAICSEDADSARDFPPPLS